VNSVPIIKYLIEGYRMACFTASTDELRHDQLYILIIFMSAKLCKNLKITKKIELFLIFIMILNKINR